MAAAVLVVVMAVVVAVLVVMDGGLVAVLMAVVGMRLGLMGMFVLVLVFAMATHANSTPFNHIFNIL
jgi:hypothetical protein